MAINVDISLLFERLGRMYIQVVELEKGQIALRQQNGELSRTAGEALRALEELGHKGVADRIMKGEPWDVPPTENLGPKIVEG